ncbi:6921_t:CDS:2, partial [Gigaspora margarita]
ARNILHMMEFERIYNIVPSFCYTRDDYLKEGDDYGVMLYIDNSGFCRNVNWK